MREGQEKGSCGGGGGAWGHGRERRVKRGMGEEKVIGRQEEGGKAGEAKRARGLEGGESRRDMRMTAGRVNFILLISCLEGLIQK